MCHPCKSLSTAICEKSARSVGHPRRTRPPTHVRCSKSLPPRACCRCWWRTCPSASFEAPRLAARRPKRLPRRASLSPSPAASVAAAMVQRITGGGRSSSVGGQGGEWARDPARRRAGGRPSRRPGARAGCRAGRRTWRGRQEACEEAVSYLVMTGRGLTDPFWAALLRTPTSGFMIQSRRPHRKLATPPLGVPPKV